MYLISEKRLTARSARKRLQELPEADGVAEIDEDGSLVHTWTRENTRPRPPRKRRSHARRQMAKESRKKNRRSR